MCDFDHAAGGAGRGHARPQARLSAAAVGQVGYDFGGRKKLIKLGRQTSYAEGFCARRVRKSCSARDRDLFDGRRDAAIEIDAAFFLRNCYYMIANIQWVNI